MDGISSAIAGRYAAIRESIALAAARAGRDPDEITLIAVSKTMPAESVRAAHALGIAEFGENRVQELLAKSELLSDLPLRWHLIGHLQTNKVRAVLPRVIAIHSVDSIRLAEAIQAHADPERSVDVLIQVNTSGEGTKFGTAPAEAAELARAVSGLPALRLRGLMTLGPFTDDQKAIRRAFCRLREVRDTIRSSVPGVDWLSMGMSGDYEIAIEEGATHIRVGTALFGPRP